MLLSTFGVATMTTLRDDCGGLFFGPATGRRPPATGTLWKSAMTSQKLPAFLAASRSDVISLDVGHGLILGSEDLVLLRQSSLQHFITSLEGRNKEPRKWS